MIRSRRIALIVPFFGADLAEPAQRRAFEMAQTLCARGNDLEVVTTCARSALDDWSANYHRAGIDRSEPFLVHRFPVEPRDRALYERAETLFAALAERPNWSREPIAREEELAIVRHGIVSDALTSYVRENAGMFDAFVFTSYRDATTFSALPIVAERAVLLPFLRREPFAVSDAVRRIIRRVRALAFAGEDEYALAVALYGPAIVAKSRVVGPIVRGVEVAPSIASVAGFDLERNRYVAAFSDPDPGRGIEATIDAFGRFHAQTGAPLRLLACGVTLADSVPGVRALAHVSGAEHEAILARALAVVHVDGDDPVAGSAVEALASGVPAIVGRDTPALARIVAERDAGWLAESLGDLERVFASVAHAPAEDVARFGFGGREAFAQLGGFRWHERLESVIDGLQAIEDGRTREQALAQIAYLYPLVARMRADIGAMQNSRFWNLRDAWFGLKARLGIGAGDSLRRYGTESDAMMLTAIGDPYFIWIQQHALRPQDAEHIRTTQGFLPLQPTFAFMLRVTDATMPPRELEGAIEALVGQLYPHWRLTIAFACDAEPLLEIAERFAGRDDRISVGGDFPGGEFVASVGARDVLAPDALYHVALAINTSPDVDVIYTDCDTIDARGVRSDPFFKPDWSPETFLGRNLFVGLAVYRTRVFEAVGGERYGTGAASWYDAGLRIVERTGRVEHLPRMLYHRRDVEEAKLAQDELRVVTDALVRRGVAGSVESLTSDAIPCRLIRFEARTDARLTIIIPTRDRADLLERSLASIFERSTYEAFDVLVVDNGSTKGETKGLFARWRERFPARFRVISDPSPFNFAALNNRAVAQTDADFVVFVNNDTVVITPDWLESLLGYAQRPEIGAVGALLLYPDDTVQHGGVLLAILGLAGHAHRHSPGDGPGYFGALQTATNYSAVTGACMMVERKRFLSIGGFDENFAVAWNDVDLCLRLREQGYRNVYLPQVRLYHFESKSRGADDTPAKVARAMNELRGIREKWPQYAQRDPYYSPHLTVDAEDFGLRI